MLRISTFCWIAVLCAVTSSEALGAAGIKSDKDAVCGQLQTELSPTPLEMTVPIKDSGFHLGEVILRVEGRTVSVHRDQFISSVTPLLRPDAILRVPDASDGSALVSLVMLCQAGYKVNFDPATVELGFAPTVEQRLRGHVNGGAGQAVKSAANQKPAIWSGYINQSLSLGYDHLAMTAPFNGRADFDGAVRWDDWVIEGEVSYAPQTGTGYFSKRIVHDDVDLAVRTTVGDYTPALTGYQSGLDLAGVSIVRAYSKVKPDKSIRPTGKRSFRLEQASSVIVSVNGAPARRLRLGPGEYDLDHLPLRTGANVIHLQIESESGEKTALEFTVFFNRALLAPGMDEFALNAGLVRDIQGDGLFAVTGEWLASGYYRVGLSETFTAEVYGQISDDAIMFGGGAIVQTAAGFFNVDAAIAGSRDGQTGAAIGLDYDSVSFSASGGPEMNARVSVDWLSENFSVSANAPRYALDISAALIQRWSSDLTSLISVTYTIGQNGEADASSLEVSMNRALGSDVTLSFSAGFEWSQASDQERSGEPFAAVRLGYRLGDDTQFGYGFDTVSRRSIAAIDHQSGHGVGAWAVSAEVEKGASSGGESDPQHGVSGSVAYTGNRAELVASHDRDFLRLGSEMLGERSSLRIGSAIAFANGAVAVGRPVSGGFAIVDTHPSLEHRTAAIGQGADSIQAESGFFGPALVSNLPAYSAAHLAYEVEDLPPGYDLGASVFDLFPAYRGGFRLTVGSQASVMAQGVLIDEQDQAVGLLAGSLRPKESPGAAPIGFFTLETGAFFVQGLSPGVWVLEIGEEPKYQAEIVVPGGATGVVELQTIKVR
jgi:outer membrane usher protein